MCQINDEHCSTERTLEQHILLKWRPWHMTKYVVKKICAHLLKHNTNNKMVYTLNGFGVFLPSIGIVQRLSFKPFQNSIIIFSISSHSHSIRFLFRFHISQFFIIIFHYFSRLLTVYCSWCDTLYFYKMSENCV